MSFFGNRRQNEPPPPAARPAQPPPQQLPPVSQPVGFETVLGANTVLEGTLRSNANVRLDGTFTGTLEIGGNVLVGETAKINADINAKNISIAGAVRGNVSGKKVQLLRTGRIWGDIHAMALTTEEGAFIDGKITMISQEADLSKNSEPTQSSPPPNNAALENATPATTNPKLTVRPKVPTTAVGATEQDMDEVLDIAEGKLVPEEVDVTQDDAPRPFSPEAQEAGAGDTFPLGADASEGQDSAASGTDAEDRSDETRQGT
jgi:cytoskeletal protein CcmA (bactofilin family)